MIQILETDTPIIIARKIYNHFLVNQSCTIEGFTETDPIGKVVWDYIVEMDYEDNFVAEPGRQPRRKYKEAGKNSIGGRIAHKIFCHNWSVRDKKIIWHIWRKQ